MKGEKGGFVTFLGGKRGSNSRRANLEHEKALAFARAEDESGGVLLCRSLLWHDRLYI